MKTVKIISPLELKTTEFDAIKTTLKLSSSDQITQHIDPSLIAGIVVEVDGFAVDLSVKRQLAEIAQG